MGSICDTCHAGCCRGYQLVVSVFDVLKISRELNLPIGEFATLLRFPASETFAMGGSSEAYLPIRFSDPGCEGFGHAVSLKRVASSVIPNSLRCYFLLEWERAEPIAGRGDHPGSRVAGRCGIYGVRPLMCRTFPTTLTPVGVAVLFDPKPLPLEGHSEAYRLCPEPWPSVLPEQAEPAVHSLAMLNYEVGFQNKAVGEWNGQPGRIVDFFPFMIQAYQHRLRLTSSLTTAPGVS